MGGDGENAPPAAPAVVGVRLMGLLIAAVAFWQLLGNVLDTWRDFDPSYAGYYFGNQLLRPVLGLAIGAVLMLGARWIGKRAGRL